MSIQTEPPTDTESVDVVDEGGAPPWLRRAAVLAVGALIAYGITQWAFVHLCSFLATLFLAWLLSISIEPVVDSLERWGLRRGAAAGLVLAGVEQSLAEQWSHRDSPALGRVVLYPAEPVVGSATARAITDSKAIGIAPA